MISLSVKRKRGGILDKIKQLTGPSKVKVGFPSSKVAQSNIEKAVWNEFGTRGGRSGGGWGGPIPERPFMRNAMRSNAGKYRAGMKTMAPMLLKGELTLTVALQRLGISAESDIKAEISSLMSPPNSPTTIALKGSSKPLIDSGAMRQSVTWQVFK